MGRLSRRMSRDVKLDAIDLPDDLAHPFGVEGRGLGFPGLGGRLGGPAFDLAITADGDLSGTLEALRHKADPGNALEDAGQRLIVNLPVLELEAEIEHQHAQHLGHEQAARPGRRRAQLPGPDLEGLPGLEQPLADPPQALVIAVDGRQADALGPFPLRLLRRQLVEQARWCAPPPRSA